MGTCQHHANRSAPSEIAFSVRTGLRTVALRTSFKMPVSVDTILETPSLETPAFRVTAPVTWATVTASKSTVSLVTATGNQSLVTGGFAVNQPVNHPAMPDYVATACPLLATTAPAPKVIFQKAPLRRYLAHQPKEGLGLLTHLTHLKKTLVC